MTAAKAEVGTRWCTGSSLKGNQSAILVNDVDDSRLVFLLGQGKDVDHAVASKKLNRPILLLRSANETG